MERPDGPWKDDDWIDLNDFDPPLLDDDIEPPPPRDPEDPERGPGPPPPDPEPELGPWALPLMLVVMGAFAAIQAVVINLSPTNWGGFMVMAIIAFGVLYLGVCWAGATWFEGHRKGNRHT